MAREVRTKRAQPGGEDKSRSDVEAYKLAFYGGLAGEALWLSSYPLDVIKSKMQTDGLGFIPATTAGPSTEGKAASLQDQCLAKQKYATTRACIARTWQQEGVVGFWRGIGPTLARAMPVSAATFAV